MANFFPVVMVTGPRQSGKTTMLRHVLRALNIDFDYVTLDNVKLRADANSDPEEFLRRFRTPLLIDEFQYAPELLSYIKIQVDKKREESLLAGEKKPAGLYFLTGSQVFQTMKNVSESLAGRVGLATLHPLSQRELEGRWSAPFVPLWPELRHRPTTQRRTKKEIFTGIWRGGYPEVQTAKLSEVTDFYNAYLQTYIERDLRDILTIKNESKFVKFLRCLALNVGQEYNASDLSRSIEVNSQTIDSWLSVALSTHLIYLLPTYASNELKRVIKRPKIYFMDTGLACNLAGYADIEALMLSPYAGHIFENWVISEVIKSYTHAGFDPRDRLYYYRDSKKREIDLVVASEKLIHPVEIKTAAKATPSDVASFAVLAEMGETVGAGSLIYLGEQLCELVPNVTMLPLEYV